MHFSGFDAREGERASIYRAKGGEPKCNAGNGASDIQS